MVGVLLLLIIQIPLTNDLNLTCLNENKTQSNETNFTNIRLSYTTKTDDFWEDQKYFNFACIIATLFIVGNILLIIFVNEINGKLILVKDLTLTQILLQTKCLFHVIVYFFDSLLNHFCKKSLAFQLYLNCTIFVQNVCFLGMICPNYKIVI
jgi:hypothetical protein